MVPHVSKVIDFEFNLKQWVFGLGISWDGKFTAFMGLGPFTLSIG